MKIQKHAHGMLQHFTNQPMLEVPQIMDANACHRKAFGQVRADRLDPLAQPCTELEEEWSVGRGHSFAGRCHHHYPVPVRQQRLAEGVDKAFKCPGRAGELPPRRPHKSWRADFQHPIPPCHGFALHYPSSLL